MGTRWSVAGIAAGAITVVKIVALATLAVADPGPMGRGYALALTVTMLLGIVASGLLIGGWAMTWVERRNGAYAEEVSARAEEYARGVADTVDRLAQALPAPPPVRRVS